MQNIDLNNLTEADLRDIFDDINTVISGNGNKVKKPQRYDKCPYCMNTNIMEDNGIIVCVNTECGQVIDVSLDKNPEWHNYDEDNNKDQGRCAMPINPLLPMSSIGTSISGYGRNRVKTLQAWSAMPYRERSLNNVFKIIHDKCLRGNIIKCVEDDAKIMYKSISDCKHVKGRGKGKFIIIRGKNRESLIAACIFFACRRNGKTRTPKEIGDLFSLDFTEITRGCKNFLKLMKIKNIGLIDGSGQTSHPEHFVVRFCNELQVSTVHINQALQIAKNIRKLNLGSVHIPVSTAICSILIMADINKIRTLSKKKLATKFGISDVTIAKAYSELEKFRKALINDEITDHLAKKIEEQRNNKHIPASVLERLKKFQHVIIDPVQKTEPDIVKHMNNNDDLIDFDIYDELDDDLELDGFDDEYIDDLDELNDMNSNDYNVNMKYMDEIINMTINDNINETFNRHNKYIQDIVQIMKPLNEILRDIKR